MTAALAAPPPADLAPAPRHWAGAFALALAAHVALLALLGRPAAERGAPPEVPSIALGSVELAAARLDPLSPPPLAAPRAVLPTLAPAQRPAPAIAPVAAAVAATAPTLAAPLASPAAAPAAAVARSPPVPTAPRAAAPPPAPARPAAAVAPAAAAAAATAAPPPTPARPAPAVAAPSPTPAAATPRTAAAPSIGVLPPAPAPAVALPALGPAPAGIAASPAAPGPAAASQAAAPAPAVARSSAPPPPAQAIAAAPPTATAQATPAPATPALAVAPAAPGATAALAPPPAGPVPGGPAPAAAAAAVPRAASGRQAQLATRPEAVRRACAEAGALGWPFCEFLALLPDAAEDAVAVRLNREDGAYNKGDYLVVEVTPPAGLGAGHLHLMFLDGTGAFGVVMPNRFYKTTPAGGGRRVRVGVEAAEDRRGVPDQIVADEPYGYSLVLALLTRRPLPGWPPREGMQLDTALNSLARALPAGERLWAAWRLVEVRPRG